MAKSVVEELREVGARYAIDEGLVFSLDVGISSVGTANVKSKPRLSTGFDRRMTLGRRARTKGRFACEKTTASRFATDTKLPLKVISHKGRNYATHFRIRYRHHIDRLCGHRA